MTLSTTVLKSTLRPLRLDGSDPCGQHGVIPIGYILSVYDANISRWHEPPIAWPHSIEYDYYKAHDMPILDDCGHGNMVLVKRHKESPYAALYRHIADEMSARLTQFVSKT